ncbi:hypothetical protein ABK040_012118 [Willaertia magna]
MQTPFLSKIFSSPNSFLPQVRKRLLFHNVNTNISIINNNNNGNGKLYHSYHTNLITNIKKTNNNKRSTKKSTSSSLSKKQQQVNNNITNKPSSSSSSSSPSTVSSSFTNSNVISSHNSPTTTIISQPKQQQTNNNNNNNNNKQEEEEVDAINFIKQPVSSSNENYSLNNLYDQAFKSKPILQTTSLFTNEFARLSRRKLSNNNIQQQQQLKREEELKEKERMREELLKNINESNNKKINDDSSITTTIDIKKQEINNNAAITKTNKNVGKKVDKKTKMNVVQKQQEKIVVVDGKKGGNKKNEKKLQQDGKNNAQILNKYNPLYINFLNHLRTRFKNISQQQQEEEMTPKIYQNKRKLLTINNTNEKLGESEVVEELFKDKVPNKENNILTNNQQEVNKKITTTTDPTIAQKKYSLTEIKKHILKLKELSKTGNLQELETYFKNNIEYPNIFHYNLLLSSFARYLKFDLCENYFKEMEYKSIETNNIMLEVYLKSKQFDKLQKLFKSMKIHDEQSWNILLEMFEKLDNNLQRVKQCFRIIPNPTIENFNMLMEIFLRHRHYQMVEVIFNELMSISNNNLINNNNNSKGGISDNNNIKNNNSKEYNFITNKDNNNELVPNEITYDLILRSYLGLNHFDKLLSTFNQIPEELNSTLHYITLFEMYRRQQQQNNNNNNVAEKMEELFLNKIPKHKRKHEQINALIIAFGKSGNLDKAKYYFENVLEEHGFEPNEYDFTAYLDACATVGSKIRTQQFFNSIPNPTGHDYSILMQCYVKAKEFARAEEIFYSFKGVEPEPHMHSLLVAALVGQKKEVRAERHVRELLLSDNSGGNNNNNNNSKLRKSPQFYSVCMFELAKSTKSIKFIEELYNNCPFKDDILILNNYLFAYAMIGDVKKVEEIFKAIPKPNEKTFEYRERAYSVAKELQKQQNRRQQ